MIIKIKTEMAVKRKNSKTLPEDEYFHQAKDKLAKWSPCSASQSNKSIQVIDLFSGCGGMSLGFAALGKVVGDIQLIGAADINEKSLETFKNNFKVPALNRNVRELSKDPLLLNKFLQDLEGYDPQLPQILIGCAPCQGFTAHRKKNWDQADERNGLIEAFTDIAITIKPDCVIMENVPELLSKKYWNHFQYFKNRMSENGYIVKQSIHNSAAHGVPQERFRAIVIAMRKNFYLPLDRLQRNEFKTVRDAIGDLNAVEAGEVCSEDFMHKSAKHKPSTIGVIKAVPLNGGSRPEGVGPKCLQGFKGFADVYGRLSWNKPSITITHYSRNPASGRFVHPEQHRGLTIRESARLQSFPDGFIFSGSSDDMYRQIGEAVPPLLSTSIAATVYANFKDEIQEREENLILEPVNNSYSGVIAGIKGSKK